MGTIISIDLDRATAEQTLRFNEPHLHQTLATIRDAVGDKRALIHVRRHGKTLSYAIQTMEDFQRAAVVNDPLGEPADWKSVGRSINALHA